MITKRLEQESHVFALKASDFEVDCIRLELALDRLFIMLANLFETFQKVHFDHAWLVLIPPVVFDWNERHVAEIQGLTIRSLDFLFLLFFYVTDYTFGSQHSTCN